MAVVAVRLAFGLLLHQFLQLGGQPLVALFVVRLVAENDAALGIESDTVVRDRADLRR